MDEIKKYIEDKMNEESQFLNRNRNQLSQSYIERGVARIELYNEILEYIYKLKK